MYRNLITIKQKGADIYIVPGQLWNKTDHAIQIDDAADSQTNAQKSYVEGGIWEVNWSMAEQRLA